ncbi:MAG: TlpA disulfide reductase family protein [Deferrisomatales bacterium]|nr:TlpA disulfide reductase family protein [Deferrisomatales bacterium]
MGSAEDGWEFQDLGGAVHRMGEWRGRWVLIRFGRTTCPSCADLIEEIAAVHGQVRALGVEVLDIYLGEAPETVQKYWAKKPFDYRPTIWCAPQVTMARSVVQQYGISFFPHLLLVDPKGAGIWHGQYLAGPELVEVLIREMKDQPGLSRSPGPEDNQ